MPQNSLMQARTIPAPRGLEQWSVATLAAIALHAVSAVAIVTLSRLNEHDMMQRPELAVELDMDAADSMPKSQAGVGGGGGAGGAIASPVPLTGPQKAAPAPAILPDFIEPVKGAAPAGTGTGSRPVGYGPGYGGGMGGGIGGGIGNTAASNPRPAPPVAQAPEPTAPPPAVSKYYTNISTARYSSLIVYPAASVEAGEEGVGILAVTITPDGKVRDWRMERSTGKPRLDAEIVRVAQSVDALDPLPADFPGRQAIVHITIAFRLEG